MLTQDVGSKNPSKVHKVADFFIELPKMPAVHDNVKDAAWYMFCSHSLHSLVQFINSCKPLKRTFDKEAAVKYLGGKPIKIKN